MTHKHRVNRSYRRYNRGFSKNQVNSNTVFNEKYSLSMVSSCARCVVCSLKLHWKILFLQVFSSDEVSHICFLFLQIDQKLMHITFFVRYDDKIFFIYLYSDRGDIASTYVINSSIDILLKDNSNNLLVAIYPNILIVRFIVHLYITIFDPSCDAHVS